jgi:hypothetical protein
MTWAPAQRASCTPIEPTPPLAPWITTVWPDSEVAVVEQGAVDLLADRDAGGAVAERDHDARPLVGRDQCAAVVPGSIAAKRAESRTRPMS